MRARVLILSKSLERDVVRTATFYIPQETVIRNILVVDDDRAVRDGLLRLLRARGYVATGACTGSEAVELAQRVQPHLIIVDIVMSERGGLDIARAFKSDPMLALIPIIALTASPDLVRDHASLFRAVLTKPCPSATLFRTIEATAPSAPPLQ